jgi:hypothetical protein
MNFSESPISGLKCKSSSEKHDDNWLNDDVLVRDRAVDGRDSGSGLDSELLIQSIAQSGYLEGVREGGAPGAGVFGDVNDWWWSYWIWRPSSISGTSSG